ncbi:MAG: hypothetical protein WCG99_03710 [Candidatus Berkelbacteria bacterium]
MHIVGTTNTDYNAHHFFQEAVKNAASSLGIDPPHFDYIINGERILGIEFMADLTIKFLEELARLHQAQDGGLPVGFIKTGDSDQHIYRFPEILDLGNPYNAPEHIPPVNQAAQAEEEPDRWWLKG